MITVDDHRRGPRRVRRRARAAVGTVGLVPTMGYFHEGHRSLMRAARAANDFVVVSLFVNPHAVRAERGPRRVPARPRRRRRGRRGRGRRRAVHARGRRDVPGRARARPCTSTGSPTGCAARAGPTHFDGVTTVVAKLFSIVGPCRAYFGRKDAQQLAVIRRMTADLDLPGRRCVGCPLVREPDGLAMSSRNAYLTADERARRDRARRGRSCMAAEAVVAGERDAARRPRS